MRPCSRLCHPRRDRSYALALAIALIPLLVACRGQPTGPAGASVSGLTSNVPGAARADAGAPGAALPDTEDGSVGEAGSAAASSLVSCLAGAPPLVARIAGQPLTLDELAPEVSFQIYRRQVDVYGLVAREVERVADARLLAAEARRRGTSPEALVEQEAAGAPPVTEAEVDAYLREHPARPGLADARSRTAAYLAERGREERRIALLARLREGAGVELLVPAPRAPRIRLDLAGAPARGPGDAPVTLVHFASFASPAGARSAQELARIVREHPGRIRWVHRNQVAPYDERGLRAAAAALEVARLDPERFWRLHDRLFARDGAWTDDDLDALLGELGVSRPAASLVPERLADIKRELSLAASLGLEGAPVVFVNGRYFSPSFPPEDLERLVREELAAAGARGGPP